MRTRQPRRGDGYPQLSSLRSSLRSSFDPHSDPFSDPPSILTPILAPILTLPSEEPSRQFSTLILISILTPILLIPTLTPIAGWAFLWGDGKGPGIGADAMHAKVLRVLGPRPRQRKRRAGRQSDSDAVATSRDPGCHQCREWRVNKTVDLGWKT